MSDVTFLMAQHDEPSLGMICLVCFFQFKFTVNPKARESSYFYFFNCCVVMLYV
jgi:hypothetical protein